MRRWNIKLQRDGSAEGEGDQNLQPATDEYLTPHRRELADRNLQADRKEQQDHPDLGHRGDRFAVFNEAEACGADNNARQQKRDDRGDADALHDRNDAGSHPDDDK